MASTDEGSIEDGLANAHADMLRWYAERGGHRFHGWIDHKEPRSYLGSGIWTEADCVFQFARQLEVQFPGCIHLEFKINKATRGPDFEGGPRQSIDIVISDLDRFIEDEDSLARFQALRHDAFIEAKWLKKGLWGEKWEHMATKQTEAVLRDAERLQLHLDAGRCQVAAVLVVDDECYFHANRDRYDWPRGVSVILVGPAELSRRGMHDEHVERSMDRGARLSGADRFMWMSDDDVQIYDRAESVALKAEFAAKRAHKIFCDPVMPDEEKAEKLRAMLPSTAASEYLRELSKAAPHLGHNNDDIPF